jgi:hypothetical protein
MRVITREKASLYTNPVITAGYACRAARLFYREHWRDNDLLWCSLPDQSRSAASAAALLPSTSISPFPLWDLAILALTRILHCGDRQQRVPMIATKLGTNWFESEQLF